MKTSADLCVTSVDLCVTLKKKLHRVPQRFHRDPQKIFTTLFLVFLFFKLPAQEQFRSIHFEQNEFYKQFGEQPASFYDSLDGFAGSTKSAYDNGCQLQRVVFGFHPYWAGSDYLRYQWNLLSDLCYFSYEVDPSTGDPVTVHDWLTDPAIDSAKAHGVRVHLCATIFSGHTAFFNNPAARQNLIDNLVSLVQARGADGVNMDIEAVPSSVSDSMTAFMQDLSVQLKTAVPGAFLSIDLPAVDWNNNFQIDSLAYYLDWFFIMGYDYYYNGSSQAGPVSPLYSLVSNYNYSLSRTISAYETAGIDKDKFILGIPYYGRQWKTASNSIPSPTLANGTAVTYSLIRNNGGTYNPSNYTWEPNSLSSCYIFFQNDNWNQCFIGLDRDLRKKYDIVNYRDLAGIGIWALGYDDGYPELWQAISDKFSDCCVPLQYDTLLDSGGPTWNYYSNEDYYMTIDHGFNDQRYLSFTGFSLEDGYDSLWVYAGPDTTYTLLGGYTGDAGPGDLISGNGAFTLKFRSDGLNNAYGWRAVFHDGTMGMKQFKDHQDEVVLYPNPAHHEIIVVLPDSDSFIGVTINDVLGNIIYNRRIMNFSNENRLQINLGTWPAGTYILKITDDRGYVVSGTFVKVKN